MASDSSTDGGPPLPWLRPTPRPIAPGAGAAPPRHAWARITGLRRLGSGETIGSTGQRTACFPRQMPRRKAPMVASPDGKGAPASRLASSMALATRGDLDAGLAGDAGNRFSAADSCPAEPGRSGPTRGPRARLPRWPRGTPKVGIPPPLAAPMHRAERIQRDVAGLLHPAWLPEHGREPLLRVLWTESEGPWRSATPAVQDVGISAARSKSAGGLPLVPVGDAASWLPPSGELVPHTGCAVGPALHQPFRNGRQMLLAPHTDRFCSHYYSPVAVWTDAFTISCEENN